MQGYYGKKQWGNTTPAWESPVKRRICCIWLAGAEGFEPSDDGTKTRCLTSLATPQYPSCPACLKPLALQHDKRWQYVRSPCA